MSQPRHAPPLRVIAPTLALGVALVVAGRVWLVSGVTAAPMRGVNAASAAVSLQRDAAKLPEGEPDGLAGDHRVHRAATPEPPSASLESLVELRRLAASDPRFALEQVARLEDEARRRAAAADPELRERFERHADELNRDLCPEAASWVALWASADVVPVRQWIEAQPASGARDLFVGRLGYVWAKTEPREAARWILRQTTPGQAQSEVVMAVLHQWALRDLEGAFAWMREFPPGPLRERALSELEGLIATETASRGDR